LGKKPRRSFEEARLWALGSFLQSAGLQDAPGLILPYNTPPSNDSDHAMAGVLAQMCVLILCGMLWRRLRPFGLDADAVQRSITGLVFNALLPALVLAAMWGTGFHPEGGKISIFGTGIVAFGIAATLLCQWLSRMERRQLGAAMLGISFPNVTFLGLPVLEQLFDPANARIIVIQLDLFATGPLVYTVGLFIAAHYGEPLDGTTHPLRPLVINPPLWAALMAMGLTEAGIDPPFLVHRVLDAVARPVAPLMLLALGLGLRSGIWQSRSVRLAGLAAVVKLIATPWFGFGLADILAIEGDVRVALVLEAAMPSMLLGIVYCDRYRLDTGLYAMLATLTTLLSLATLPLWYFALTGLSR
jgi:predicted permease